MKIHHETDYAVARRLRYPPVEDLADALYHQSQGNQEPMKAYMARCDAVKKSCPKPPDAPATPGSNAPVQLALNLTVKK